MNSFFFVKFTRSCALFNGRNLLKKNNTVMERYFIILLSVLCLSGCRAKEAEYDVCIYGGTSSGVVAAYSAAQKGLDVVLVEPSEHIGGMTTGGLGYTDIGNKQVVKGIAKQFYRKVGEHYGQLEQWICGVYHGLAQLSENCH